MEMMLHRQIRYIGLDVHKASIAVAIAEEEGAPSSYGNIANDPSAIRKLMTRRGGPDVRLRVAYEAGPTGYAVHRQLTALGIECSVVAPSLIPKRPCDKIKNRSPRCAQARPPAAERRPHACLGSRRGARGALTS